MIIRSIHDIAAAVRGRRTDMGLSQAELARRSGVSRKWIYEFEAGKPKAELALLLRVLDQLHLDLNLSRRPEPAGTGDRSALTDLLSDLLDRDR